jgi:glycosyltransferase involved in cell wall biosynthesis
VRKLLWIGDAVVSTGFARCTHKTLDVLKDSWEVHVLGVGYVGDPHQWPYAIYPCLPGGDVWGVGRTAALVRAVKPDVVVVQNDPWNIPAYVKEVRDASPDVPIVAAMPVDGRNCQGNKLEGLALAVFWTEFGLREARRGGYEGPAVVVPLGVDLDVYRPIPKSEAREKAEILPHVGDAFVVGNVNRNQPRKRLDLTVRYFAEWVRKSHIDDAFLYLHIAPTKDDNYDVMQLMRYYGFRGDRKRLVLAEPEIGFGIKEELMPYVYSCFDVQLTTTQGEGWGLTTMEGMACGVPQIVPKWSALGEWTGRGAIQVPCTTTAVTPCMINVIGGVPDEEMTIQALQGLYQDVHLREKYSKNALEIAARPEYRWPAVGRAFGEALDAHVATKEAAA